jgi:hypothetical protein
MHAPDRAIRPLDDIVRDAVKEFDAAWKRPHWLSEPDADDAAAKDAFECDFRITIRGLRALNNLGAPLWGYRAENVRAIKKLRAQIAPLHETLKSLPHAALFLLFADENGLDDRVPDTASQQKMFVRCQVAVRTLVRLRARCDQIIANEPGKHGLAGYLQERHAKEAFDLLAQYNLPVTSAGSDTSLFRTMARLVHEGVTGDSTDLERACKIISGRKKIKKIKH